MNHSPTTSKTNVKSKQDKDLCIYLEKNIIQGKSLIKSNQDICTHELYILTFLKTLNEKNQS